MTVSSSGSTDKVKKTVQPPPPLKKRIVRRVRSWFEVGAVYLAWWVIPSFPRKWIDWLAWHVGPVYLKVAARDRKIMRANLDLVYGSPQDPDSIAERSELEKNIGRNVVRVLLDYFWFSRDTRQRIEKHVELDEATEKLAATEGAIVFVTGHLGAWELAAQAFCLRDRRGTVVYSPVGSSATQRLMLKMRSQNGQDLVPREGALVPLLRALKKGHFIGLLLDQRTTLLEGGVFVDFMGLKTTISKAAGLLAERTGTPIYVHFCRFLGAGQYRVESFRSLQPDHGMEPGAVHQWIADALGDAIREVPEQWLWMYRRWRIIPPGEDPARYPYYAHKFDPDWD